MNARILLPALALLLAACAGPDRIVLLPDNEGKVGKLNVSNAGGETLLDSAYATANAKGDRKAEAGRTDPKDPRRRKWCRPWESHCPARKFW